MSGAAIAGEIQKVLERGRRKAKKERKTMAETDQELMVNQTDDDEQEQKEEEGKLKVQHQIFDLERFDSVLLVKYVDKPKKPENFEEARQMVEFKTEKLLELIHKGLIQEVRDAAYDDMTEGSWRVTEPKGEFKDWKVYNGKWADDKKIKIINAAVLNFAKLQGYGPDKTKEENDQLKEQAKEFLRSSPIMTKSLTQS